MPDLKRYSKTERIIFIKKFLSADPSEIGSTKSVQMYDRLIGRKFVDLWSELYQKYHQRILYPNMLQKDCKNKIKIH